MRCFWKRTLLTAIMACAAPLAGAMAQDYNSGANVAAMQAQIAAQQAQLDAMQMRLEGGSVFSTAAYESTMADDKKPAAPKAPEPYEVGSDLKMSARWNPANGLTFETPNKDFVSHLGMRFQMDTVGWRESQGLKTSGFGPLEDGVFFRRIRPSWDGTMYEVVEWNLELALEQTQNNVPNLDNCWVGLKDIPVVGAVRVGHMHLNQGLEGDMSASSKAMTFLERATYTDAFYENLGTGVFMGNHIAEDHVTWSSTIYRQDNALDANGNNTGADFNNGAFGTTGRVTVLPFYQDDGRHMLHLGASATIRDSESPTHGAAGVTQFRARPELRDQIGASPLGNGNRLIDTGAVVCQTNSVVGTELFYVLGPASLQAEYAWAQMNKATGAKVTAAGQGQNIAFGGGYVQASYFLTGENRIYDRRFGVLGTDYIATPYTPFWAVKDADGDCCWGWGAWEVATRYSHLTLDNHFLVSQGGQTDALEAGVNWYLNTNLKLQFEYLHETAFGGGPNGSGTIDGFGMRTQFFF